MYSSIIQYITPEQLNGQNQYECSICKVKVDALKGVKIKNFPDVLTFSLNRFDFDFQTMQRVKINDNFQFYDDVNLSGFQEDASENA